MSREQSKTRRHKVQTGGLVGAPDPVACHFGTLCSRPPARSPQRPGPGQPTRLLSLLLIGLVSLAASGAIATENPLFQSHETLSLVLEFPLRDLLRQKQDKATVPGVLRYTDVDGNDIVLDVGVSTRGNSRLDECRYPPLRLNLKKKQVAATLFGGQDKLKLVNLCRDTASYRRYLDQEYTLYRAYNLVSEYSFRARRLEVTYSEMNGRPKATFPAFFIESDEELANRLEMTPVKSQVVGLSQLDAAELATLTLFQFMIGNTDWSVQKGPGAEACCHNGKVVGPKDSRYSWVVVPYDFDQAGLINASYALPSETLPIRSVRQRLYRGFCSGNAQLESTIALFTEQRAAIEALFTSSPNGTSSNKAALKYLQSFYKIIDDSKKTQKHLIDHCRGPREQPSAAASAGRTP